MAWGLPRRRFVAFVGLDKLTTNVSFGSAVVSPLTVTAIVCVVTPGAKVSVPVAMA